MRALVAVLSSALLAAAAAPAAAQATCAATPLADLVRGSAVIVTAQAQPGPTSLGVGGPLVSPASFRVRAWDKGSGPATVKVTTGRLDDGQLSSEGIYPLAGQVWRLYGALDADGVLTTTICSGSLPIVSRGTPALLARSRTTSLRAASVTGVPRSGKLPSATVGRAGLLLRVPVTRDVPPAQDVAVLLVKGGVTRVLKLAYTAPPAQKLLTAKLTPALVKGGGTLVVITRSASFAATLRAA